MRLLLLVPVLLLAAACGGADDPDVALPAPTGSTTDGGPAAGGGTSQADNDLVVVYDAGDGSAPQEWSLTCAGTVQGTHPDAEAACAHLLATQEPFAPVPADAFCTEQYGGPQTATVTGRWAGEPVDLQLSRVDGCRISQWDRVGPLLPQDVGVEPPR